MRRKRLFGRGPIALPKMTIQSNWSWPLKVLWLALVLGLGGVVAIWAYDMGRGIAGFNPAESVAQLKEQIELVSKERDALSSVVNAAESKLNIERAAQKQLASQVKILESDNAKLKEDLAFFDSLLPADTGPGGISIRRLTVDMISPNQLRYRLLVMQGGKGANTFVGNLQLEVPVVDSGKNVMIVFPEAKSIELDKFKLSFKHYQRVEGLLTLPQGVVVKTVQARVLEKGQVRAQQAANL
ncbi:MAG: DUF6776 family protein [Pseudomonadota bacterium]